MGTRVTDKELIAIIESALPGFASDYLSRDNLFLGEDDQLTLHGVWAYCSQWVGGRLGGMPAAQTKALAMILNSQVGGRDRELSDAASTCFLQNLAGNPGTAGFRQGLSGIAARRWDEFL